MTEVECVLDAQAELGECPVWAAEEQALYWVDIKGRALHRFDPAAGDDRSWPLPQQCGSFALRASGGAVLALADGFYSISAAAASAANDHAAASLPLLVDMTPPTITS